MRSWKRKKRRVQKDDSISLDEILLDASNLPSFNTKRLEGRIELPLARRNLYGVGLVFFVIAALFVSQLVRLQVIQGAEFATQSEDNKLAKTLIIAERGIIYDRNGELLAWNELDPSGKYNFPVRAYTDRRGLGQVIGYVSYPQKDSHGIYYRTDYLGRSGMEQQFDGLLHGTNGDQLIEENAHGQVISEHEVRPAVPGGELHSSVDAGLSEAMYDIIATSTVARGFRSGAAAIMDIHTGEMLAMTSFPSYDPEVLADGNDVTKIKAYNNDSRFPFLNKIIAGVYTPGSIVKPFVAYGALNEHIISPNKIIVSNGAISVPNPYDPAHPSIFRDWRAQGPMTMRDAIAYSSDVYFYTIGGGFQDQKGLGIDNIDKYMSFFGIGHKTGIDLGGEIEGTVPSPSWKEKTFNEPWRLGDTYHTSIGQFGFLVTPIEMLDAYAALANGGTLVAPTVVLGKQGATRDLHLDPNELKVVTDGMRGTVIQDGGTARPLERNDVHIAAKSGTAELGATNSHVNTWVAGYFPYEDPKYAFILFMEYGPHSNTLSAGRVMNWVFDWMHDHRPEYLGLPTATSTTP